jgi:hypothetical protein
MTVLLLGGGALVLVWATYFLGYSAGYRRGHRLGLASGRALDVGEAVRRAEARRW